MVTFRFKTRDVPQEYMVAILAALMTMEKAKLPSQEHVATSAWQTFSRLEAIGLRRGTYYFERLARRYVQKDSDS